MYVFVDDELYGATHSVVTGPTLDHGADVGQCLLYGFSVGVVVVPPGKHTVRIEVLPAAFHLNMKWGAECFQRYMLEIMDCCSAVTPNDHDFSKLYSTPLAPMLSVVLVEYSHPIYTEPE
jgi:hypothetical protein